MSSQEWRSELRDAEEQGVFEVLFKRPWIIDKLVERTHLPEPRVRAILDAHPSLVRRALYEEFIEVEIIERDYSSLDRLAHTPLPLGARVKPESNREPSALHYTYDLDE